MGEQYLRSRWCEMVDGDWAGPIGPPREPLPVPSEGEE